MMAIVSGLIVMMLIRLESYPIIMYLESLKLRMINYGSALVMVWHISIAVGAHSSHIIFAVRTPVL